MIKEKKETFFEKTKNIARELFKFFLNSTMLIPTPYFFSEEINEIIKQAIKDIQHKIAYWESDLND